MVLNSNTSTLKMPYFGLEFGWWGAQLSKPKRMRPLCYCMVRDFGSFRLRTALRAQVEVYNVGCMPLYLGVLFWSTMQIIFGTNFMNPEFHSTVKQHRSICVLQLQGRVAHELA